MYTNSVFTLIVYIKDIVDLFDDQCSCKLYADDIKLYTIVHRIDFQPHFQQCLDRHVERSDALQLNISYKKCAVMNISCTGNNPITECSTALKAIQYSL